MLLKLPLCGLLLCCLASSSTGQFDVDALDAAILADILQSYTEHVPSTCTGASGSTAHSFVYPGINPDSEWYEAFKPFEEDLFLAAMTHTDSNNRSWSIRIGSGGNMYSHFCPDLHGESLPPQAHTDAPWVDEVLQSVSVNSELNEKAGACNGETCPSYFVHGAGAYQRDAPYTDVPFYSQSLAKYCSGDSCTFAAWAQQAHVATVFTSPLITLNKYTNCGNGIIEHTEMIYNFAAAGSSPVAVDQHYFNLPWGGVRKSNLPYALEPENDGSLNYDDPDSTSYVPLCMWGDDEPGGPQGRGARADLDDLGGFTTFVGNGLYLNRPAEDQKHYLWCRKPGESCFGTNTDGSSKAITCMADPNECYNSDGSTKAGYIPVTLQVPPNSDPGCLDRGWYTNGYELRCKLRTTGFGRTNAFLDAAQALDPCAPWVEGGKMGFYRNDNNQGFEATFIRHWSWNPSDNYVFLRVDAPNFTAARNIVHAVFDNTGNSNPLSIRFQTNPPVNDQIPSDYNPGALPSVTFVAGDGLSTLTPGKFRRRIGSTNRDYYVYTNNYYGSQALLEPGYVLSKRAFLFASDLASAKSTADSLKSKVVYDMIEDTRFNPRAVNIYKSGTSFDVVAASTVQGSLTTCTSPSANLECSGFSTPRPGYSPFFYVTCGSASYLGADPCIFTPGNGDFFTFPNASNDNNKKIRSYACDGQDESVRPQWKLIGFFDVSTCVSLGSGVIYDDSICALPSPTGSPTNAPSSSPTRDQRPYVWCSKPGGCNSGNEATCMANRDECYNADGFPKEGYTPVKLQVPPNSNPGCSDRGLYSNGYEIQCKLRTTGFGRTQANISPPSQGGTLGFYRSDNNQGFEVTFIRHWSWRISDNWLYLRVDAPNFTAARNIVHAVFDNTGNSNPLSIQFEYRPLSE